MTQLMEQQGFRLEVEGETCLAVELYSKAAIDEGIQEMGRKLAAEYQGASSILMVPLLQGAVNYAIGLRDAMHAAGAPRIIMDGMRVESYKGTESNGDPTILKDMTRDPKGRHILVVDDIFDTGHTLSRVHGRISGRDPSSLRITTLLDKPSEKRIDDVIERIGGVASVFTMEEPYFVIGRGMDYNEEYRGLPYIAKVVSPLPNGGFDL